MTDPSSSNNQRKNGFEDKEESEVWKHNLALLGNGNERPLNKEQINSIEELYQWAIKKETEICNKAKSDAEIIQEDSEEGDVDGTTAQDNSSSCWSDRETCRRYLVARKWDFEAAKAQLLTTLEWRFVSNSDQTKLEFWQSPKALQNPWALTLRIVGWDKDGHPVGYMNFRHACDRWDVEANMLHLTLLLDATIGLLRQRQAKNLNQTASSRRWIWVIDFDGFGWRDQNPKTALRTAKLLNRYPEVMHRALLLNAPRVFSTTWKLISPLLEQRISETISFQTLKGFVESDELREALGSEAMQWIQDEVKDNWDRRHDDPPKKYWTKVQAGEHNARGMKSYVESEFYIRTPGDAWEEQQK